MTTPVVGSESRLRVIRFGTFSGSGVSLVDALRSRMEIEDVDVTSYRRDSHVMWGRLSSLGERAGNWDIPATKTASWSSGVQKALDRRGLLGDSTPVLFVQSIHAYEPPQGLHYAVYTDRVAREGDIAGGDYRSRFTRAWLSREERFLRQAAVVFVMGPTTKAALIEMYGIDPVRVAIVGAGPNVPVVPRPTSTRIRRLVFVGVEWDRKGGPELLDAFASARGEIDDLELLVVGSLPEGDPPPGVRFAGRLSSKDVSLAYSESDALVIPTHMEAFGIAIVEALLHGIPCVGTTVGNQEWLIGDAGMLVPPGDRKALAEALLMVARDCPRFQAAAAQRSKIYRQAMQWPIVANKILSGLLNGEAPDDLVLR